MVQVDLRATVSEGLSDQSALARVVAEQAIAIRFDDIPSDVVALAKIHVRDQLGVGLLAATLPRNRPLAALACKFYDCALPALRDDAPERLAEAVDQLLRAEDLAALTSALHSVR